MVVANRKHGVSSIAELQFFIISSQFFEFYGALIRIFLTICGILISSFVCLVPSLFVDPQETLLT